jgi:uncharacterized protein YkwD
MASASNAPRTIRRVCAIAAAGAAAGSLFLTAVAPAAAAARCTRAVATPAQVGTGPLVQSTLCLLNRERGRYGLRPLRLNARLTRAALEHSRDMVSHHYFAHMTPAGITPSERMRATGYLTSTRPWTVGENLEWGTQHFSSPEGAVNAWMHSPEHRANILSGSYREIGIGIAVGSPRGRGEPAATYTTDFGAKG